VITSTSEVYGKAVSIPFREDDDTLSGATSKHRGRMRAPSADEFLALAHFKETKLPVAIVRLFNTVGPRQTGQYGMVVRACRVGDSHEPIVVYGDGLQSRCFAHVLDVVEGSPRAGTRACFGKVINLGTDHEISINDLAAQIIAITGSGSRSSMSLRSGLWRWLRRYVAPRASLERHELIGYDRCASAVIIENVAAR